MRKYPIEDYLVDDGLSIRAALEQIERTERRTLFVIDAERHLLGSVTDGDIRRWLLQGGDIGAALRHAVNPHPLSVGPGYDRDQLCRRLVELGATCVPLLDEHGRVVDLVFWEDLFLGDQAAPVPRQIQVPVVIMAGGRGTRLAPFTQVLPKPLVPVGDKTVIEVIIDRFLAHGIREFHLTLGHKANLMRAFFQELTRSYAVHFVNEDEPLGTAGALGLLAAQLDRPFILTNCDIVIEADYADLVEHHVREANQITLVVSLKKYHIPYGVCEIATGGQLTALTEKPEFDLMVNTGMYVVSPAALPHVPAGRLYHMTDLIADVRAAGGRVGVYPIGEGAWLDTGEWAAYRATLQHFESRLVR
ncbi:MAG TPA: sugar phosphate nucleotidyltransferase [Candidatus Krumholzibacteria bacterium]|nr:sugar phosphate nucleotidyltransferase [Candidatus Krumholzibacteria bacterium]HPD70988.1 sugar phosphate nucleotidyltransferase [Candidatus Krumholzibacteria bacterium]HRY39312.1 sugar phosphate nucleotidyltransferase [Candidatus Krumholzibacteria bacterium]